MLSTNDRTATGVSDPTAPDSSPDERGATRVVETFSPGWKRLFDIVAAATALVALSPVIALLAYRVKRTLGSPVIFRQTRPGLGGEPFEMLKFRSMRDAVDANGNPLPDDERITPFGSKLRDSSLDELPELVNVLRGEMSIVGPRPLLMQYLPLYSHEQMQRHAVRPGVTGLAQVNGRNAITWPEKFAFDTEYVRTFSPLLDLKVIAKTISEVLNRSGVNADDMAAGMPVFTGDIGHSGNETGPADDQTRSAGNETGSAHDDLG